MVRHYDILADNEVIAPHGCRFLQFLIENTSDGRQYHTRRILAVPHSGITKDVTQHRSIRMLLQGKHIDSRHCIVME